MHVAGGKEERTGEEKREGRSVGKRWEREEKWGRGSGKEGEEWKERGV